MSGQKLSQVTIRVIASAINISSAALMMPRIFNYFLRGQQEYYRDHLVEMTKPYSIDSIQTFNRLHQGVDQQLHDQSRIFTKAILLVAAFQEIMCCLSALKTRNYNTARLAFHLLGVLLGCAALYINYMGANAQSDAFTARFGPDSAAVSRRDQLNNSDLLQFSQMSLQAFYTTKVQSLMLIWVWSTLANFLGLLLGNSLNSDSIAQHDVASTSQEGQASPTGRAALAFHGVRSAPTEELEEHLHTN